MTTALPPELPGHRDPIRTIMIGLSLAFYVAACALPALGFERTGGSHQPWGGGQALMTGWMGVFVGQFAWFANPLLLGAWICLAVRTRRWTLVFALGALLVGAHTLFLFGRPLPADESGSNKITLTQLLPGFYAWAASMVSVGLGGLLLRDKG